MPPLQVEPWLGAGRFHWQANPVGTAKAAATHGPQPILLVLRVASLLVVATHWRWVAHCSVGGAGWLTAVSHSRPVSAVGSATFGVPKGGVPSFASKEFVKFVKDAGFWRDKGNQFNIKPPNRIDFVYTCEWLPLEPGILDLHRVMPTPRSPRALGQTLPPTGPVARKAISC